MPWESMPVDMDAELRIGRVDPRFESCCTFCKDVRVGSSACKYNLFLGVIWQITADRARLDQNIFYYRLVGSGLVHFCMPL